MENNIARADALTRTLKKKMHPGRTAPHTRSYKKKVFLGVDVGTANVVTVAVSEDGIPLAGRMTAARVTREGMIVDYLGAVRIVSRHVEEITEELGCEIYAAMSAIPPGTEDGNKKVTRNILEAADLHVTGLVDEPEASALVLGIRKGVVVDIGGGTTGVSLVQDGKVIYSVDEPTGGFHFDLVIAGNQGISIEEAEKLKRQKNHQKELFPVVRPVMEKVACIIERAVGHEDPGEIWLVGGSSSMYGFTEVVQKATGISTRIPGDPLLTTPLGIALTCCGYRFFQSGAFAAKRPGNL